MMEATTFCMLLVKILIASLIMRVVIGWAMLPSPNTADPFSSLFAFRTSWIWDPYEEPLIVNNVLSGTECKSLVDFVSKKKKLEESLVLGRDKPEEKVRRSTQTWLKSRDHPTVEKLTRFAVEHFRVPRKYVQDAQVVKYEKGGFYKPHHDQCDSCDPNCLKEAVTSGPRYANLLVYLNEDFEGGGTRFPSIKREGKELVTVPKTGRGVAFYMLDASGRKVHPKAMHGGEPIKTGKKWIVNLWVRKPRVTGRPGQVCRAVSRVVSRLP